MFQLRELEYFLAIVETGSVSAAARAHWVSQPAISKQIAAMERSLGTRLFRRVRAGMALTPAGERLVPVARDLVTRLHRAEQLARSWTAGELSFRVACPATTGESLIRPFIADGAPIHDILPADPGSVYEQLQHGADLALSTWEPPAHLSRRLLFTLPITAQAAEPLGTDPDRVELSDLADRPLLIPGYGSAVERLVFSAAYGAGLRLPAARTVSNGTIAQALSSAGRGVALVIEPPRYPIANQLLVHDGAVLKADFHVAWEPDHYAAEEIADLAGRLARWLREHRDAIINHPLAEVPT